MAFEKCRLNSYKKRVPYSRMMKIVVTSETPSVQAAGECSNF
jgi:hypothetical protein